MRENIPHTHVPETQKITHTIHIQIFNAHVTHATIHMQYTQKYMMYAHARCIYIQMYFSKICFISIKLLKNTEFSNNTNEKKVKNYLNMKIDKGKKEVSVRDECF